LQSRDLAVILADGRGYQHQAARINY